MAGSGSGNGWSRARTLISGLTLALGMLACLGGTLVAVGSDRARLATLIEASRDQEVRMRRIEAAIEVMREQQQWMMAAIKRIEGLPGLGLRRDPGSVEPVRSGDAAEIRK